MPPATFSPKFSLGHVVATPGAIDALEDSAQSYSQFIHRHVTGDWGDLCDNDKEANDEALVHESRILSAYKTTKGVKLWIITEADRSATTLLLPSEY